MGNKALLSVKNLNVHYVSRAETVKAVNDVSFDLEAGETIGLVGETGAGKTSIAKAIMSILPTPSARITSGKIELNGEDLLTKKAHELQKIRGKKIAMVFQDPMTALNPVQTVGKQIAEGIKFQQNISWAKASKQALEIFKLVGISAERFGEYPHQFSGGMKQRVVIAITLACSPELLICDEPTTALDVTIQAQVLDMIKDLQRKKNMAMIMITHDFGIVAETCDKVCVVYAGQIVEAGNKRQIFKSPKHPYTKGLFGALPDMKTDMDRLKPINGVPPDPSHLPEGCFFMSRCEFASKECAEGTIPTFTIADGHQCRCLLCRDEATSEL